MVARSDEIITMGCAMDSEQWSEPVDPAEKSDGQVKSDYATGWDGSSPTS